MYLAVEGILAVSGLYEHWRPYLAPPWAAIRRWESEEPGSSRRVIPPARIRAMVITALLWDGLGGPPLRCWPFQVSCILASSSTRAGYTWLFLEMRCADRYVMLSCISRSPRLAASPGTSTRASRTRLS